MQPAAYLADIAELKADRRTLTVVMHADMVGYSRLIGLDDAGTLVRLRRMRRQLIDPAIAGNGGTIRQTAGDSLLVIFDSIDGAMQSAIAIQRGVGAFDRDAPPDQLIRFRVGINIGMPFWTAPTRMATASTSPCVWNLRARRGAYASRAPCATTPATNLACASRNSA
jgi:class 3 adenylate cyclase